MEEKINSKLTRRSALRTAAGVGTAAALTTTATTKTARAAVDNDISVTQDGTYERVPLKKDVIRVKAIQSPMIPADADNPKPVMRANLQRMLDLVDQANGFLSGKQDLVCFYEQPIMGWAPWTREEALKVSIEVPGHETEALGKKAKEHGCYIAFASYVKDEENWPGHLLLNGILIGPDGSVVANHWKQHNVRINPRWTMYTTSAYDVLPRYIEMYGKDAVLPVARTDIGNFSLLCSPYDPDIHRAIALKGVEISLRFSSGGFNQVDSQSASLFNDNYTITMNQSISPDNTGASGAGGTSIYGPRGKLIGIAKGVYEQSVSATIPIAEFRRNHRLPDVPMALVMPVYEKYGVPIDPGLSLEYLPTDMVDSARYIKEKRNW
ncbi:MAG: hypothetical protein HN793_05200 [Rhodospirillaceae bacterium]|jgi:predicted amidohydrolase|nr:hypothetical protein [Rhodospirillaceae bacterium]MBT5566585.1 hypothetical protein [Rhodospirillaceae bacterium]MBT6090674.1 hypothetical protein [Rhodospirillaceae bacterium]MBT7450207.1 hypothetical protein [Rhodospirillaceae bacterium]